jgi:hypothetical protein
MAEWGPYTARALAPAADFLPTLVVGYQPKYLLERSVKPHLPPKLFETLINHPSIPHPPHKTHTCPNNHTDTNETSGCKGNQACRAGGDHLNLPCPQLISM